MTKPIPVAPGTTIGRWTVIEEVARRHAHRHFRCRCACGRERDVCITHLRSGASRSCGEAGCYVSRKHGQYSTPEYAIWCAMKQRCHNQNHPHFNYYGGRGIRVCERWQRSFAAFIADVGLRPSPELSLDRIDNDGNYEAGNVRWTTRRDQQRNQRPRTRSQAPVSAAI